MPPRLDDEIRPARALMRESGLSLSKAGFATGRQALITPRDCSRQVRSAIDAYWSDEFVAVMSDVILIRTRVMIQMLLRVSVWWGARSHVDWRGRTREWEVSLTLFP